MAGLGRPLSPKAGTSATYQTPVRAEEEAWGGYSAQEDGGGNEASPKEQQTLEQFVETAKGVIYPSSSPGQVFPQIMADLKGQFDQGAAGLFADANPPLSGEPGDNVAATAVLVTLVTDSKFGLLEQSLSEAEDEPNEEMPGQAEEDAAGSAPEAEDFDAGQVLMQGGKEVVQMLVEATEAANIHEFSEDDVQQVFLRALDLFRFASEKVDPRFVESLKRGFAKLVEADRAGQLNRVLPGLPGGAPMGQQR